VAMSRRFAIYIGLVGAAALISIAWPAAVLIGLFVGVIPGLILWVAPSLFLYSLLWWGTRAILLRIPAMARLSARGIGRFIVSIISAAIIAVPAFRIPHLINMRAEDAAQQLQTADRELEKPVALPDTVVLVIDGNYNWSKRKPFCETLCLRLLFNSAVARVIAVDPVHGNTTSAFWIERRDACPESANMRFDVTWKTDGSFVRGDTLQDRLRARVSSGECLIEGDGRLEAAAMTIAYRKVEKGMTALGHPWSLQPDLTSVNRLEVSDASGATIYRRTEVAVPHLTAPLQVTVAAGLLTTVTYAGWARTSTTLGEIGPHGRDVLPNVLGEAVRKPEPASRRAPAL